ncbi:MAG: hypothetical protein WA277_07265 [Nitrospirota bacterium]
MIFKKILLIMLVFLFIPFRAFAAGECGLSCCIAGASSSGVTLASKFGISLQYEYSYMKPLREGSAEVTPGYVFDKKFSEGAVEYKVPIEMIMQKYSLIGSYPVTNNFILIGIVPYVINDMTMRHRIGSSVMDMKMDTVSGIGDASLFAYYTFYQDEPVRPSLRFSGGIGVKTPTGKNDEKDKNDNLYHAMMQPGTGSWDPLFMINGMVFLDPIWLQANIFYHLTTKGDSGYEFGDQLSADVISRYQLFNYINIGLEVNGVYAGKDKDHDNRFTTNTALLDDISNTGLFAVYVTPAIQVKIPNTGGSLEIKYQQPIYQNANGIQQVIDWRVFASFTWNF